MATKGTDLSGKLYAARRSADHHYTAIRQETGVPKLQRREAVHLRRQTGTERWDRGKVASSTRYHKVAAAPWAAAGREFVASIQLPRPSHARSNLDRDSRELGIALQKVDDLRHRHEA